MAISDSRFCMCLNDPDPAAQKHYKAAILKNSRWQPGDKITIRFLSV
jgi:hypothetical protein